MKLIELCDEVLDVGDKTKYIGRPFIFDKCDCWYAENAPILARACKLMLETMQKISNRHFTVTLPCNCCDRGIKTAPCSCFDYDSIEEFNNTTDWLNECLSEVDKLMGEK